MKEQAIRKLSLFVCKLIQYVLVIILSLRFPLIRYLIITEVVCDAVLIGYYILGVISQKDKSVRRLLCQQAVLCVCAGLHFAPGMTYMKAGILTIVCILLNLAFCCYDMVQEAGRGRGRKISKRKRTLMVLAAVLLALTGAVASALLSYRTQPVLSREEIRALEEEGIWTDKTAEERAAILEDNETALEERIRMIQNARHEIILSTFEFRDDNSGSVMLGALIDAADRGVRVKVIVDGMASWTSMEWNPNFYALAAMENAVVRIYNKANPLTAWKSMGRMHDKYLIADRKMYIIGGRNTYDYFLGDFGGHKNYDRDILVYCQNPDENSSVNDLLRYFETVWNYEGNSVFGDDAGMNRWVCVRDARARLLDKYNAYTRTRKASIDSDDYLSGTVRVDNIALLSNPIDYRSKKPVVWYRLTEIMKNAVSHVKIHTPYIICNDYMYDGLAEICEKVDSVSLMTNSTGNNGNPFGAADYSVNKQRILDTGIQVWEYEGGVSYHGKSILVDDHISIIGSFNLDMRSAYLDTELMLVVDSIEINEMLGKSMDDYEHSARMANSDGTYFNPYDVIPVELSPKRSMRMNLIRRFLLWARYLF